MRYLLLLAICSSFLPSEGAKALPKGKPNAAGVCKERACKTTSQSGFAGYCKKCFRVKFPQAYAKKLRERLKECLSCGEAKDLRSTGLCKACTSARSCDFCQEVNLEPKARTCPSCETTRSLLGATRKRLAMWCAACFTEDQRASGKCFQCFKRCHHCGRADVEMQKGYKCTGKDCGLAFFVCVVCYPSFGCRDDLVCKNCWYARGEVCISCSGNKAQHDLNKFRFCWRCRQQTVCQDCSLPPPAHLLPLPQCRTCGKPTFWCVKHASPVQLGSGTCAE